MTSIAASPQLGGRLAGTSSVAPRAVATLLETPEAGIHQPQHVQVEMHYSPAENLERIDVATLAQAKHTIDLAAYVLTDIGVLTALSEAAERGVAIRLYIDGNWRSGGERVTQAFDRLVASQMVEMRIKPQHGAIMHLKGYVVDGALLRTGSANFSLSGLRQQDNDLLLVRDPHLVRAFEQNFDTMWVRERQYAALQQ